jgi:hypothetical protein
MVFQINICSVLWFAAILYTFIYTCAMLYVIIVNRCRFNCSNKAVFFTFWLIFAMTLAGSTLNFKAFFSSDQTCEVTTV